MATGRDSTYQEPKPVQTKPATSKLSNIAGDIGVQITTLRTQLSAILRKFDVDRQSDIIRVVSNISASRGAPGPDAREEAEPAGMGDGCLKE